MIVQCAIPVLWKCASMVLLSIHGDCCAWGFRHVGYVSTLPLAALLMLMAAVPVLDDVVFKMRKFGKQS
jgi:hypothetical protein